MEYRKKKKKVRTICIKTTSLSNLTQLYSRTEEELGREQYGKMLTMPSETLPSVNKRLHHIQLNP